MKISALKTYWIFSTRADVEERLPSAPQSGATIDVSGSCAEERPGTASVQTVLEIRPQPHPSTLSTNHVREPWPEEPSTKRVPRASQRANVDVGKRPRRNRGKIGQLYEEDEASKAEITAGVHAACLLLDVALTRPHLVGTWVAKDQLCRWYEERVARDGGKAQSWVLIGRALKKWTASDRRTRKAKKRTYYKIPTITSELKKYAAISHLLPKPAAEAA